MHCKPKGVRSIPTLYSGTKSTEMDPELGPVPARKGFRSQSSHRDLGGDEKEESHRAA